MGSVLLAGILLKVGGYGLLRFTWPLFPVGSEYFAPFIMVLCCLSMVYAGLTACRQTDLKQIWNCLFFCFPYGFGYGEFEVQT